MSDITYYSPEGLKRLKEELAYLKTKGRADIALQLAEAREKGDLKENAEYDAAKDAQGMLELKINKLEKLVADARILDESQIDTSKVTILSTVKVKNLQTKKAMVFTLVAEKEADLKTGKISVKSPIGQGLLGLSVGDVVDIQVPAGVMKFEVLEITR